MSREMKNSGIPWIGDIPKDWAVCFIKQIMRNKSIKGHPEEMVLSLYRDYGVVPKNSRDDNHNVTSEDTSSYKFVEVGDFVINKMKAWQGSMAVSDYQGIISPAYYICRFTTDDIDRKYIHYLLRNDTYKAEYMRLSSGMRVGQWDLNIDDFLRIKMVLPSLSEQQKIASFLDRKCAEIDEMIALQEKIIEKLTTYKQSVITEAVTKGLNPDVLMKDSGVEWIGEIPEHWEAHPFKAFYKTTKGLNITKDNLVESGIPVISYGQIHSKLNTGTSINDELIRYVPADYLDSNPECLSKKYDIFFADTSEDREGAGNIAFIDVDTPIFAGYHTIMAHPSDCVKSKYFAYLIKTDAWRYQLRCRVQGVKLFSISQKFVNQTSIIIPPMLEQMQISDYLDEKCFKIDTLIRIKQSKIDNLKEYKKSVIYEYVTGKKEVTE